MKFLGLVTLALLIGIAIIGTTNFSMPKVSATSSSNSDGIFGLAFDSNFNTRPSRIPLYTIGLGVNFSISTTGTTCISNPYAPGATAASELLTVNGTTGTPPVLRAFVEFLCTTPTPSWEIFWYWLGNFMTNGKSPTTTLSTTTYPKLTGNMSIYYNGAGWTGDTYVSQTGSMYSYNFPSKYIQGTNVSSSYTDLTGVQDSPVSCNINTLQCAFALNFTASYSWNLTEPRFDTDIIAPPTWYSWNVMNSTGDYLDAYAFFNNTPYPPPFGNVNTLEVGQTHMPYTAGVDIYYYGLSPTPPNVNGEPWSWLIKS